MNRWSIVQSQTRHNHLSSILITSLWISSNIFIVHKKITNYFEKISRFLKENRTMDPRFHSPATQILSYWVSFKEGSFRIYFPQLKTIILSHCFDETCRWRTEKLGLCVGGSIGVFSFKRRTIMRSSLHRPARCNTETERRLQFTNLLVFFFCN